MLNTKILCAGANAERHRAKLKGIDSAVDICVLGSECNKTLVIFSDGTVKDLDGFYTYDLTSKGVSKSATCHAFACAIQKEDDTLYIESYAFELESAAFKHAPVSSFAIGDIDYSDPFIIAVKK